MKRLAALVVAILMGGTLWAQLASAHAYLERSDPPEGAYLPTAPREVTLWFTERLEPSFSRGRVVDKENQVVSTGPAVVSSVNPKQMTIPLGPLPNGVYTVIWENVSADDGHAARGAFAFAVGNPREVGTTLTLASAAFGGDGELDWLGLAARWVNLLAATALLGALLFTSLVIAPLRPHLLPLQRADELLRRREHALLLGGALALGVGWPLLLLSQLLTVSDAGIPGVLAPPVVGAFLGTRYGSVLLARAVLIILVLVDVLVVRRERELGAARLPRLAAILTLAGVLAATSVVSHAAGVGEWAWVAVLADWTHQAATACWIGGVFLFTLVGGPLLAGLAPEERRPLLLALIPRFSGLAIASVAVLSLTGLYAAWLHFPTLESIFTTAAGQALALKSALFLAALALGALNFLLPARLRRLPTRALVLAARFVRQLQLEAGVGVLLLGAAALMVMFPPASVTAGRPFDERQQLGERTVQLRVAPNQVGANRYLVRLLDRTGQPLPAEQVVLRFQMLDHEMGRQEVRLTAASDGSWVGEGANLSMVGNWGSGCWRGSRAARSWTRASPSPSARQRGSKPADRSRPRQPLDCATRLSFPWRWSWAVWHWWPGWLRRSAGVGLAGSGSWPGWRQPS
ncbi:MAG: copper resistance protein CopC [Chloroflexi bacterium]|nr:copper resistance protein CopC [Chloroflexota bacterium]